MCLFDERASAMCCALNFQNILEFVGTQNTYDLIVEFRSTNYLGKNLKCFGMNGIKPLYCTASSYYYDIVIMTGSL